MAINTENGLTQQMVAQLRLLDPSYSAEPGTPERLILEAVASLLAGNQIDLIGLENALNIETKFGQNLDNFLQLFSFERIKSTKATGYVIFTRPEEATIPYTIPAGTAVQARKVSTEINEGGVVQYVTTSPGYIPFGGTETNLVPIEAVLPGTIGNTAAKTITEFSGETKPFGISAVSNPSETTNGSEAESDNALKIRFKNTVFRNLSGTEDQYLALAIAMAYSTKANVIGPVSNYLEYVQVPKVLDEKSDDTGGGGKKYEYVGRMPIAITKGELEGKELTLKTPVSGLVNETPVFIYTVGAHPKNVFWELEETEQCKIETVTSSTKLKLHHSSSLAVSATPVLVLIGEKYPATNSYAYTSALSTIPYAKYIWNAKPVFISNAENKVVNYYFRQNVDYVFNNPPLLKGDTLRYYIDGIGENPGLYLGAATEVEESEKARPNITFINVDTSDAISQSIAPEQILLLEYSYTSKASRNKPEKNLTNAVDVYVDGENSQATSAITTIPPSLLNITFSSTPTSFAYYENYRRAGEPTTRPRVGNTLIPLIQQPVTSLPSEIVINKNYYYLGTHYWLVEDVSEIGGSIRSRSGIEWNELILGSLGEGDEEPVKEAAVQPPKANEKALADPPVYKGKSIANFSEEKNVKLEVENYTFDKNVSDLQASIQGARQITTDVLAHHARKRYLKFDITVVYSTLASIPTVNTQISEAVSGYFKRQTFGAVIILSDILQTIHNVPGVENVRWTSDVISPNSSIRAYQTDINGRPLAGITMERTEPGEYYNVEEKSVKTRKEKQRLFIAGKPTSGVIYLQFAGDESSPVELEMAAIREREEKSESVAAYIESQYEATSLKSVNKITCTEETRPTTEVKSPIKSFIITYAKSEKWTLPRIYSENLASEEYAYASDFYLGDNELPALPIGVQTSTGRDLPGDTIPGFIIRSRSQGAFQRGD